MAQVMGTSVVVDANPVHPTMNWGAIISGWFVATAIAGLLYVAGLALGFTAFHPHDVAATAKGIGIGTAVWVVLSWVAGLFVGGMFASWFDGKSDETMGAMHGVAVWGVSLTATALWIMLGAGSALHRGKPDGRMAGTASVAATTDDDALVLLKANVHRLAGHAQGMAGEPPMENAVVAALLAGHDATAKAILLADTSETPEVVDQAMTSWSGLVTAAQTQMKDHAEHAARYLSHILWVGFLSGLLALIAATGGGWLGARNVHRVYHTRRYPGRPFKIE